MRFRPILVPLLLFLALTGFSLAYRWAGLPSPDETVGLAKEYFNRYGYGIVFAGAFLEAVPALSLYLPGSTVVILAVALSKEGSLNPYAIVAAASAALAIAHALNYALGRYGWHGILIRFGFGPLIKRTQERLRRLEFFWLWLMNIHPNTGTIASTAAGLLEIPFGRFFPWLMVSILFWSGFWASVAYAGGDAIIALLDMRWLIALAALWLAIRLTKAVIAPRSNQDSA